MKRTWYSPVCLLSGSSFLFVCLLLEACSQIILMLQIFGFTQCMHLWIFHQLHFSRKSLTLMWTYVSSVGNSRVFINVIPSLWLTNKSIFVKSINLYTNTSLTVLNENGQGVKHLNTNTQCSTWIHFIWWLWQFLPVACHFNATFGNTGFFQNTFSFLGKNMYFIY